MNNNNKNDLILKYQQELHFNISTQQANFFLSNFSKYENILSKIINFNFSDYTEYLYPSIDEKLTISFSSLREDEPIIENETQKNLFKNAVDFIDGYVVLKNEK